jgi:hypothetical protein
MQSSCNDERLRFKTVAENQRQQFKCVLVFQTLLVEMLPGEICLLLLCVLTNPLRTHIDMSEDAKDDNDEAILCVVHNSGGKPLMRLRANNSIDRDRWYSLIHLFFFVLNQCI